MFNDRFNDRVRRYRLTALLVLAVLVLLGLGAGHLATRAVGAAQAQFLASALFRDALIEGRGLVSDGAGPYTTTTTEGCVWNRVNVGPPYSSWYLDTPRVTGCTTGCPPTPVLRHFKLWLGGTGTDLYPKANIVGGCSLPLHLSGPTDVWGRVQAAGGLFSTQPNSVGSMAVYFRTDSASTALQFALVYQNGLTILPVGGDPNTSIVTTDLPPGSTADPFSLTWAELRVNQPKGPGTVYGTFSVPCWIQITKLP